MKDIIFRLMADYRMAGWLGVTDTVLHKLHIPMFLWRPICDAYDRKMGAE